MEGYKEGGMVLKPAICLSQEHFQGGSVLNGSKWGKTAFANVGEKDVAGFETRDENLGKSFSCVDGEERPHFGDVMQQHLGAV